MKIISLRFLNLNSLAGEWEINLQDPSFISSGIFAITGPTGSGKTTILDAICLALYGQTPRLEKISSSTNEIMTRHTGECYAEVLFESSQGTFRCNWRQKRARGRSDGKLQQPEHEIVDAKSNQVLENKLRDVAIKVRETTGMDFEQFTRSMLLAQGGFSAFLEAKPDDRAPILEQITGTGIYSEISRNVHERYGQERNALQVMEAELGSINILNPDEEASLQVEKEQKSASITEITITIQTLQKAIDCFSRISELKKELINLDNDQSRLMNDKKEAEQDLRKLDNARKALVFEASWKNLTGIREKYEQGTRELERLQGRATLCQQEHNKAESVLQNSQKKLQDLRSEFEEQRPIIFRIRETDTRIEGMKAKIDEINEIIENLVPKKEETQRKLSDLQEQKQRSLNDLEKVENYLQENVTDAQLITTFSGINHQIDTWIREGESLANNIRNVEREELKLNRIQIDHQEKRDEALKLRDEVSAEETIISNLKKQRESILDGQDIGFVREQEKKSQQRLDRLRKLRDSEKVREIHRSEYIDLQEKEELLGKELFEKEHLKAEQFIHYTRQEELVTTLDSENLLSIRVRDLEEERIHLQDGAPCPLCGSLAHPYISFGTPQVEESEKRLSEARKQLKEINNTILQLESHISALHRDITNNQKDQKKCLNKLSETELIWNDETAHLGLEPSSINRIDHIESELFREEQELSQKSAKIVNADHYDKQIREAETSITRKRQLQVELNQAEKAAEFLCTSSNTELERLHREHADITRRIETGRSALNDILRPFHIQEITMGMIEKIRTDLTVRYDLYRNNELQRTNIESQVSDLLIRIAPVQKDLTFIEEQYAAHILERKEIENNLKSNQEERAALYGEKDPIREEARFNNVIQVLEDEMEVFRKTESEAKSHRDTLSGQIQTISSTLDSLSIELTNHNTKFIESITRSGFSDEKSFQEALLSPQEVKKIEDLQAFFQKEETSLAALKKSNSDALYQEEEKLKTFSTPDPDSAITDAKQRLETLKEEILKITIQLEENNIRKEKIQGNLCKAEDQRRELTRWERLHSLIGSADGKKFRVFAQGLTFQILISHANRHLNLMTDRYILLPDPDTPLDLAVIDTWQAGEIRSTRNLSGGESFIVSLALALGLSGMASKNVRVDSLFLDEGFGTLDDDALDTALGALSGLNQQGKLIGIISHVPAIRERISTQIRVEKKSNGRSVIKAPGCRQVK